MTDILPETPLVPASAPAAPIAALAAALPAAAATASAPASAPAAVAAPAPAKIKTLTDGQGWGSTTYVLDMPFCFRGVTYSGVAIREPSGGDVMRHQKDGRFDLRGLVVDLTEVPDDVLAAMHARDYNGIMNAVGELLTPSRATSTT